MRYLTYDQHITSKLVHTSVPQEDSWSMLALTACLQSVLHSVPTHWPHTNTSLFVGARIHQSHNTYHKRIWQTTTPPTTSLKANIAQAWQSDTTAASTWHHDLSHLALRSPPTTATLSQTLLWSTLPQAP